MDIERTVTPADGRTDVILAATLYLLSALRLRDGGARLPNMVAQHFAILAARDDLDPVLRSMCCQLRDHWRAHSANSANGQYAHASLGRAADDSAFVRFKQRLVG